MDALLVLRVLMGILAIVITVMLIRDCIQHRTEIKKDHSITYLLIGFLTCALDTLGIGDFATGMAAFKLTHSITDEEMVGTINVGYCLTTLFSGFLFLSIIEIDTVTLVGMIAAAIIGSTTASFFVTKLPVNIIRKMLGVALLFVAFVMACRNLGVGPFGATGTALELRGVRLAIGIIGNFLLGALQSLAIGLYAPCMGLVGMLGMNITAAFPIMMSSSGLAMPFCSWKYILEGKYNRAAAVLLTISGFLGIALTYIFIKSISINVLVWIVVCVMIYTSINFFRDAGKKEKNSEVCMDD